MMQSKDYSEDIARIIDEETKRILHEQEARCQELLTTNRNALNLVARNLLEHETLSGAEVNRLIAVANNDAPPAANGDLANGEAVDAPVDTSNVTDL